MFETIRIQALVTIVASLMALIGFDSDVAFSVLLGGASAVIPNGLFALRLASHKNKPADSYPAVFYLGEFAKIGFTIAAIIASYRWVPSANGAALLTGLVVALKAPMVAFFIDYLTERRNGLQKF